MMFLLALSLISIGFSSAEPVQDLLTGVFTRMDANKNGNLESAEFKGAIIQSYDHNNDKKISEGEFISQWNHGNPHQEAAGRSMFGQIDSNGDKSWTDVDITAAYKLMDDDGNGLVSKAEFITYAANILKKANFNPPTEVIG